MPPGGVVDSVNLGGLQFPWCSHATTPEIRTISHKRAQLDLSIFGSMGRSQSDRTLTRPRRKRFEFDILYVCVLSYPFLFNLHFILNFICTIFFLLLLYVSNFTCPMKSKSKIVVSSIFIYLCYLLLLIKCIIPIVSANVVGTSMKDEIDSKIVSPVILVPGLESSRLEAKLIQRQSFTDEIVPCQSNSAEWFLIWSDISSFIPIQCWINNMRLIYNKSTRVTSSEPGQRRFTQPIACHLGFHLLAT